MRVLKQTKIEYYLAPGQNKITEVEIVGSWISVENVRKEGDSSIMITTQHDTVVAMISDVEIVRGFLVWPKAKVHIQTRLGGSGYVLITQYEEG